MSETLHNQPNTPPLTAEEQLLLMNDGLPPDPNALLQVDNTYEYPVTDIAIEQQAAEQMLADAEQAALNNTETTASLFSAVEEVKKDSHVAEARKAVEVAFGAGQVTRVEQTAIKAAIESSNVMSQDAERVANTVAHGNSPLAELGRELPADQPEAVAGFGALRDKTNGTADIILHKVVKETEENLKDVHIRGVPKQEIKAEVLADSGADLSKAGEAKVAAETAVAREVIDMFASKKPGVSEAMRAENLERIKENPDLLRALARQVARRRSGATTSGAAARSVGHGLSQLAA